MMTQTKIRRVLALILVILLTVGWSSSFDQAETEIVWNESRKLTWNDFKGNIPTDYGKKGAETASGITTGRFEWNDSRGKVKLYAYFDCSKSWTRLNNDKSALNHEQGHFDITEIYARKLRKKLNCKKFNRSTYTGLFRDIYNENESKKKEYQLLYDKETNHHNNIEKQKEWDLKIEKELKSLEKYKDIEITIILKGK